MLVRMIIAVIFDSCGFRQHIHTVGATAKRNFTKSRQILLRKEMINRLLRLNRPVNITRFHSLNQFLRLNVHQLDLTCVIKDGIRNPFIDHDAGYGSDSIVQAFNVLYIDRCIYIDSAIQ